MKKKKQKDVREKKLIIADMIFIISFITILWSGCLITIFRPAKSNSVIENRTLNKFSMPNIQTLARGTFQKNLEKAMADQFPLSEKIKEITSKKLNFIDYFAIPQKVCQNHYVYVGEDRALAGCTDTLVELPITIQERRENIDNHLAYYNDFNKLADTYYYVIPRSYAIDVEKDTLSFDGYTLLKEELKGKYHLGTLDVKNLEDYQKYFFKTDHHWNNVGSYQGYKDIMKLFGKEDEIRPVVDEITIKDPSFFGSIAKYSHQLNRSEDFSFYTFDIPSYTLKDSGFFVDTPSLDYKAQKIKNEYSYYYALLYGYDVAELVYDFQAPDKDNLMIWASSYSNPINSLIASHFNKTFVVDIRHYEDFDYEKYIKVNDIDKILVLASTDIIAGTEFNMRGDEDAIQ